jgi:hypothetical protein
MPVTRPSYAISPPLASLPDPPAPKSLPLPSPVAAYPHHCAPFAIPVIPVARCHRSSVVSQPSQAPPCPTPSPPERPDALAPVPSWPFAQPPPQEGWEQALLDLPEGEGAPGFALNSKPLNISAAALRSFGPCTATSHYALLLPVI